MSQPLTLARLFRGPVPYRTRQVLLVSACLAALIVQVALLPLRGTGDVLTFKEWALASLSQGVTAVYRPSAEPLLSGGVPDYPPGAVGLLSGAAWAVQGVFGEIDARSRLLTFYVKLMVLAAGVLVSGLLWWHARALTGDGWVALFWGAAYWMSPARVVNGPLLGYLDGLCVAAGITALVCAGRRRLVAAAVLAVLAASIKHQGVFFLLPVAIAIWGSGRMRAASAASAATGLLVFVPFLVASGPMNVVRALLVNMSENLLSGNALNVWWLVGLTMQAAQHGWDVFQVRLSPVALSDFEVLSGFQPRLWMAALVVGAAAYLGWAMRGAWRVSALSAYLALLFHLYFVMAISVHENHQVYVVAPLLLVALEHRDYRRLAVALSVLPAVNMLLFYGGGRDLPEIPRTGPFLLVTVVFALANVVLLAVHARTYWRLFGPSAAPAAVHEATVMEGAP